MHNSNIVVAVKSVIIHEGRFLIVKRSLDDNVDPGTWEIVGGKLDFGETLEVALEREVFEEIGIRVTVDRLLYATTFLTDPSRQVVILTYVCHPTTTTVTLSSEHSAAKWVSADEGRALLHRPVLDDFDLHNVWSIL